MKAIRIVAVLLALVLAIAAGFLVPQVIRAADPLPTNDWIGLRAGPATGILAHCSLDTAAAVDGGSSVWAAATGDQALDIIQVGARILPGGRRQFFAAWGRGVPNGPGSLYEERDLGTADTLRHKYTVQLIRGAWSLSVDGVTRLRVPDSFRTWPLRAAQVQHETEGAADPFGGVRCERARTYSGGWSMPLWSMAGYGAKAAAARATFGPDWFRVWRTA